MTTYAEHKRRMQYKRELADQKRKLKKIRKHGPLFFDRHPNLQALVSMEPYVYRQQRRLSDERCYDFWLHGGKKR